MATGGWWTEEAIDISSRTLQQASCETHSAEETQALGAELGRAAQAGDVLLLIGQLGAGKTTFVQGIARGLGVQGPVTSPSFVIANEHQGRIPLYHVDLYRVEQMDDPTLEALAEYFQSDGICAVEWPDALPPTLLAGANRIEISLIDGNRRRLQIDSTDPRILAVFEGGAAGRRA